MGRWLNKIEICPDPLPTKPTKPGSVSFVSARPARIQKISTPDEETQLLQEPEYHYRADHLKPFEQEHYADTGWILDTVRLAPQDRQQALLNEYSNIYQRALTEVPGLKAVGHARRTANNWLREGQST